MASSENLVSLSSYEPWLFQSMPAYADSWMTEAFARDAETLTRALQKTLSSDTNNNSDTVITSSDAISPFHKAPYHRQQYTPSGSGVSGSDPEMVSTPTRRRGAAAPVAATKKITKRKPRATKRSPTTFIMADPANFRQMVQQVTGVRLETLQQQQQIVKPEAKRVTGTGFCLPTLDTSSFLVDRSNLSSQQVQEGAGGGLGSVTGGDASGQVACANSLIEIGGSSYGYEPYQSFPTLESWKVV
uniref:VQ domain-containing protein n=1 Tax=Kalanchoe fedtschenkoi TaxID=63787 RepID=A0A7N0TIA5_KALFE